MNDTLKLLQNKYGVDINMLSKFYPKMKERVIPLSATNITPRIFYHWKRIGIIDYPTNEEGRAWVKLNLFEYVWLSVCVILRNFGVSLPIIKQIKEEMYEDIAREIINNKQKIIDFMKTNLKFNDEISMSDMYDVIEYVEKEYYSFPEEYKVFTTTLGVALSSILLYQKEVCLLIHNDLNETKKQIIVYKTLEQLYSGIKEQINRPLIMIPFRSIVSDFLKESKNDIYLNSFELLTLDERKILAAIKDRDFLSIEIKLSQDKKELVVYKTSDFDIKDEKVKDIRIMIGLKEYDNITLTQRNNKHLYAIKRKLI
jgi:hypothetical protein